MQPKIRRGGLSGEPIPGGGLWGGASVALPIRTLRCTSRQLKKALERGVTLIEVMIVVVILGLIAGGVAIAVLPKMREAQVKTTRTSATTLRQAAERWRTDHASDQCPTAQMLLQEKAIDTASKITDAWDVPFKIACEEDETIVSSAGPDKKDGTQDDIRVPEAQKQ